MVVGRMSLMISNVKDSDGQYILAACPFYAENPLCVNSCACFVPLKETIEGEEIVDFRYGYCGAANSMEPPQLLTALSEEQETIIRHKRGWGKRHG